MKTLIKAASVVAIMTMLTDTVAGQAGATVVAGIMTVVIMVAIGNWAKHTQQIIIK